MFKSLFRLKQSLLKRTHTSATRQITSKIRDHTTNRVLRWMFLLFGCQKLSNPNWHAFKMFHHINWAVCSRHYEHVFPLKSRDSWGIMECCNLNRFQSFQRNFKSSTQLFIFPRMPHSKFFGSRLLRHVSDMVELNSSTRSKKELWWSNLEHNRNPLKWWYAVCNLRVVFQCRCCCYFFYFVVVLFFLLGFFFSFLPWFKASSKR